MGTPAVLLLSHGSPESLDQMGDYLRRILKHRSVTPEMIAAFQERYRTFGGRSPLMDICRRQARLLEDALGIPVRVGMRHWHPFIAEAVRDLESEGLGDPIVGLPLAPQYSMFSVAGYLADLRAATTARLLPVERWHRQEAFLDAWADRIRTCLDSFWPDVLLFTAHSVPVNEEDPYPREIQETIEGILPRIPKIAWALAYQSATPGTTLQWRGPDVDSRLTQLHSQGTRSVLAAPISFVCDHAEVLYDLDHLHKKTAEDLGMTFRRCPSLNHHPLLIQALAEAARSALKAGSRL